MEYILKILRQLTFRIQTEDGDIRAFPHCFDRCRACIARGFHHNVGAPPRFAQIMIEELRDDLKIQVPL